MRLVVHELRLFFIALQFFTRLPIPRWVGFEPIWLQHCARHFPLVGLLVGAFCALLLWAALWLWTAPVAVGLALAGGIWLTGGFHEDGWADTWDGLGGAVSREKALSIMKDSRIGSYGALALILMLGLKAAALLALLEQDGWLALAGWIWAHAASRAAPVWLIHSLPYAGDAEHAKAKPLATRIGGAGLLVALAWVLLASLGLLAVDMSWLPSLCLAALGVASATLLMQGWLDKRLGGFTGDNLGATQQLAELAALLGFAAQFASHG
jgi:adenosylcobinamide-GDP ribazoletransferase